MDAPTPQQISMISKPIEKPNNSIELNLKSTKDKNFNISVYYIEDKLYFNGISKEEFLFQKKYEKIYLINEIKINKFFLAHDSVKEVFDELDLLIKNYKDKNEIKIIEDTNKLILVFPLNTLKVKECLFEINEIPLNTDKKLDLIALKLKEIQENHIKENINLKNQINELKEENKQLKQEILKNKIKIQTGEYFAEFPWNSGHYMNSNSGSRSFTQHINFPESYDKKPNVSVSIKGLDSDKNANLRVNTKAINITNSGFDIEIDTWEDSALYNVRGSWISFQD